MCNPLPETQDRKIVIGIGNSMRASDGIGPATVRQIQGFPTRCCDPVDLIDDLGSVDSAVIIDACVGPEIGKIDVWTLDDILEREISFRKFNHVLGLGSALQLARTLGRLPKILWIITIGVHEAGWGEDLDEELMRAAFHAARKAEQLLQENHEG